MELPKFKVCNKCKIEKRVPEDYTIKRKKRNGVVKEYPASECKKCAAERASAYRQRLREEGRMSECVKRWNAGRDPEHARRYQREWAVDKRRREGIGPRNWADQSIKRERLPNEPIREWIEKKVREYGSQEIVCELTGISQRVMYRIRNREHDHVTEPLVDQMLTNEGSTGIWELYPEEEFPFLYE